MIFPYVHNQAAAYLFAFATSLVMALLLTPAVIRLSTRLGWVAQPRAERWHQEPTALMGGIALFGSAVTGWFLWAPGDWWIGPLLLPATSIFLLGALDDRIHLRPHTKLIGQVLVTALVPLQWIVVEHLPMSIALPLTFLWLIGMTNALNLLDNMDGLAAGISMIAAVTLGLYGVLEGLESVAPIAFALAGACAGFLFFNFNPARIFMGDSGSMFLGLSLAVLALVGTHRSAPNVLLTLLVPCAVLAIPLFDTVLVTFSRTAAGRSIAQGGTDHSSHRMVALGLSEKATVLTFYAAAGILSAFALMATHLSLWLVAVLAIAGVLMLGMVGLFLGFLRVYETSADGEPLRPLEARIYHKKQLIQVLLDLLLIPVAFVGAHLVRFEFEVPLMHREALVDAFPVVIACRLAAMQICGCYRGVWRYAGMADAVRAFAGGTLGSLLSIAALLLVGRFSGLSRSALFADWVLFTSLAVTARCGHTLLREVLGVLVKGAGRRVILVGLGPRAMPLIAQLRDPLGAERAHLVGIVDEDPRNHGRLVNGVPVLGDLSRLPQLIEEHEVDCPVSGYLPGSPEERELQRRCTELGIGLAGDIAFCPPDRAAATEPGR